MQFQKIYRSHQPLELDEKCIAWIFTKSAMANDIELIEHTVNLK